MSGEMIATNIVRTLAESESLGFLEGVIENGRVAFYQAGLALERIRDARLYRDRFETFDDYCQERWAYGRNYANKLISASRAVANVEPLGTTVPTNEAQARELAKAGDPGEQLEAWATVTTRGEPTAKRIKAVVEERKGAPKSIQCRRTPRWLFDALNDLFGPFVLDAYASADNALCERFYTEEDDANTRPWADVTFGNPEFKSMLPVVEHAADEGSRNNRSCILGPAVGSQGWFHNVAIHGTIWMPDCRVNYDNPGGDPTGSGHEEPGADRDSVVMTFGPGHWNEREDVLVGRFLVKRLELAHLRPV